MKKFKFAFLLLLLTTRAAEAAPVLIDLGQNKVMTGVSVAANGTTSVVGYQVDPITQQHSAILATIPGGSNTFQLTTLGVLSGGYDIVATAIRGNYIVGVESSQSGQVTNGVAWLASNPSQAIPIDSFDIGEGTGTGVFSVNSSGSYAGVTAQGGIAITGTVGSNSIALSGTAANLPIGQAISEIGTVAGQFLNTQNRALEAGIWEGSADFRALVNPYSNTASAYSISPSDLLIGGGIQVYDEQSESERLQATVWSGANFSDATLLTLATGEALYGRVLGVTDNGYAVGQSELGGFIWQIGWDGAMLFNDWVLSQFGISLPSWILSVNDIFFDGTNLNFALQGSAYFLSVEAPGSPTSVPEPSTVFLLIIALAIIYSSTNSNKIFKSVGD